MTRDRDASGRPRNARPRDELGRPLAGTTPDAFVADAPALAPLAALAEAQQLLDAGRPFAAHEVLEAVWKSASGPERALWRGLAQLAVGLTHRARGNDVGAHSLLLRGADTLQPVDGAPYGVPIDDLRVWARAAADVPDLEAPMPRLVGQAADERA
jgi:predicted metal-dependent hydrolase